MLPLAADGSVHGHITRGLRRSEPDIDLVRVEEAGLRGSMDPIVLEWAAAEGRVLVTQDERTMVGFAWDRVRAGLPMPGVVVRGKSVTIRRALDELLVIACCGQPEDFKDQVRFLPL
jgi:predicted nuclease of predicted toxin-antitoxin system